MSYSEFLELEPWELGLFFDALGDADREEWERTRFMAYSVFQSQSTKKLKPNDVIKFDWEKPEITTKPTTKEQFEEYKRKMGMK